MPAKASRRLVIDASVASAAGTKHATFPTSKNCRDLLLAVRRLRYHIVFSVELDAEWKRHQSLFALTWLSAMTSRRKVLSIETTESTSLRREIERAGTTKAAQRRAMQKDFHLLEAALATDKTVISLDETVRALFDLAAMSVKTINKIVWVNPDEDEEQAITWLENRAKPERKRMLGYRPA